MSEEKFSEDDLDDLLNSFDMSDIDNINFDQMNEYFGFDIMGIEKETENLAFKNEIILQIEALGTEKDTFPFSTIELVSVITSFLSGSFKRVNTILAEPFQGRLANSTFRVLDGEFR